MSVADLEVLDDDALTQSVLLQASPELDGLESSGTGKRFQSIPLVPAIHVNADDTIVKLQQFDNQVSRLHDIMAQISL